MATPTPDGRGEPIAEASAEAVQTSVMAVRLTLAIADVVRRHRQREKGGEEAPPPAEEAGREAKPGVKRGLPPQVADALLEGADWPQFAQQLMALRRAGVDTEELLPRLGEIAQMVLGAVGANSARVADKATDAWEKTLRETLPAGPGREAILSSPAWPDMAAVMTTLEERGVDVRAILASAHEVGRGVDRAVAKALPAAEVPVTSRDAMLSYGPMTTGLDIPRDLDLSNRQRALRQLAISPTENQRYTRMVREALPGREREADLLMATKQWPLVAARMADMEARGMPVGEHLDRLSKDTSWQEGPASQVGRRLVQSVNEALRKPAGMKGAPVNTAAARAGSPSVGPTRSAASKGVAPTGPGVASHREAAPAPARGRAR